MTRRWLLRLLALVAACVGLVALTAQPASAHNSLVVSDPADGAVLDSPPSRITFEFAKTVPLETVSAEIVDAAGVRTALGGLANGAADTQVIVTLPPLAPGAATVRWRLVGADGHQITGRVAFTINAPATSVVTTAAPAAQSTTSLSMPAASTPTDATVPPPEPSTINGDGFSEPYATASSLRWLLRMLAYVAIMIICAVAATAGFVWQGVWDEPVVNRVVAYALGMGLLTAVAQLLVTASDISGKPPWSSAGGIRGAVATDAGKAFAIRVVVLGLLGATLYFGRTLGDSERWAVVGGLSVVALATWAFAGHSKSMRWALVGVPLDVVHHAAAAAWLGGLGLVGVVAYRTLETADFARAVGKFGELAAIAVGAIVVTGALQTLRLVGNPFKILSVRHGQLLVLKLVVIGVMLKVGDINRKRVARRFKTAERSTPQAADMLRRAMGTELAIGGLIVAITAAMVVSPPASAKIESSSPPTTSASTAPVAQPAPTTSAITQSPTSVSAPVAACTISQTLRLSATNPDVTCLQNALIAGGWMTTAATGIFDAPTDTAVRAAQTARGLTVDGIVGPQTGKALGIWGST